MNNCAPQIIISIGLLCDIIGASLVAIEVVLIFRGPTTIDIGDSGTINGGFIPAPNPKFEEREKKKRLFMLSGLVILLIGFILQGVGTWLQVFQANSCTVQTSRYDESRTDLFNDILFSKSETRKSNVGLSRFNVAPVMVVGTYQGSDGLTEDNLDETALKNFEQWMVTTVIQKARQAYAQGGHDLSLFNPKAIASSQIVTINGSKLAIVKITLKANMADTENAVRIVRILGFTKAGAATVGCMRNSNHDIPVFSGDCGKKIKEVFGVTLQP